MINDVSGYERCNDCGLCTLPCPIWQQSHELLLTFTGRERALQGGAQPEEIKESVSACLLCGSCEPACTMGIRTVDITLKLRAALNGYSKEELPQGQVNRSLSAARAFLIPNAALLENKDLLKHSAGLLDIPVAEDDGSDVLEAFETGRRPKAGRAGAFLKTLTGMRKVVTADGLLKRYMQAVLPGLEVIGLGEALLRLPMVQAALRPTDLYIIESRTYNMDFNRCMPFYTNVSRQTRCVMNLDLQRIAIPTGACYRAEVRGEAVPKITEQIRWILEGRSFDRIVVEAAEDITFLRKAGAAPVIHVAELAGGDNL